MNLFAWKAKLKSAAREKGGTRETLALPRGEAASVLSDFLTPVLLPIAPQVSSTEASHERPRTSLKGLDSLKSRSSFSESAALGSLLSSSTTSTRKDAST